MAFKMIQTVVIIRCDTAHCIAHAIGKSRADALEQARKSGWFSDGPHLCPAHRRW